MLETAETIVLFADFLLIKVIFQFESILEELDLKGIFGKKNRMKLLCRILCP